MEPIRFHKRARVAVLVDVFLCIYCTFVFWRDVTLPIGLNSSKPKTLKGLWMLSFYCVIFSFLVLHEATVIFATTPKRRERNPNEALKATGLWKSLSVTFLLPTLLTIALAKDKDWVQFVTVVIIRVVIISVATRFANELRKASPVPTEAVNV